MNLAAIVAMVGLVLLAANEGFTAWNFRKFLGKDKDFKAAVARKALYKKIVLGVTFVCAAMSVYSSIVDKAESDAEVAAVKARLLQTEGQVNRLVAAPSASDAASSASAFSSQVAQLQEQIRRLEASTARSADVQEQRSDLKQVSSRLDVVETILKRHEK